MIGFSANDGDLSPATNAHCACAMYIPNKSLISKKKKFNNKLHPILSKN